MGPAFQPAHVQQRNTQLLLLLHIFNHRNQLRSHMALDVPLDSSGCRPLHAAPYLNITYPCDASLGAVKVSGLVVGAVRCSYRCFLHPGFVLGCRRSSARFGRPTAGHHPSQHLGL